MDYCRKWAIEKVWGIRSCTLGTQNEDKSLFVEMEKAILGGVPSDEKSASSNVVQRKIEKIVIGGKKTHLIIVKPICVATQLRSECDIV